MLTYSYKAIHKKHYRAIQVSIPICIIQAKHNWKENKERRKTQLENITNTSFYKKNNSKPKRKTTKPEFQRKDKYEHFRLMIRVAADLPKNLHYVRGSHTNCPATVLPRRQINQRVQLHLFHTITLQLLWSVNLILLPCRDDLSSWSVLPKGPSLWPRRT